MVDLDNMEKLKKEFKAIPKALRIRIIKKLHQEGNTRLCPSGQDIVDFYKKHFVKQK